MKNKVRDVSLKGRQLRSSAGREAIYYFKNQWLLDKKNHGEQEHHHQPVGGTDSDDGEGWVVVVGGVGDDGREGMKKRQIQDGRNKSARERRNKWLPAFAR